MSSRIRHFISALENPGLLHQPAETVERILRDMLGVIGKEMVLGKYTLHPGNETEGIPAHEVMRIRPNSSLSETFTTRGSLSFKPQVYNKTYQRASTPDQTMFYGSLSDHRTDVLPNRMTSTLEGLSWLRDPLSVGKQKVTYSKWIIKEDLALLPVIFNPQYAGNHHVSSRLAETIDFIKRANPEFAFDILLFYEFVASEFAKMHSDSADINYLVTANFTKIMLGHNPGTFDGILYPSCRVDGDGTNIAILPEATEKLDLIVAGECMVYKNGKHVIIDNMTVCDSDWKTPLTDFKYRPVEDFAKRGEEKIYEELGVSSLDFV
jgi:hypothetical protein